MKRHSFFYTVCTFAIPIALQSMLQASFSIIDQIMIGQLGSVSVAGVGLAAKFVSMYQFMVGSVGTVAGIMIAQYLGQGNGLEIRRSFWVNLLVAGAMGILFTGLGVGLPHRIMGLYTTDGATVTAAADYLRLISWTFLPSAACTMLSTLLRCEGYAAQPLYAGLASALLNTVLNYIFIFGKFGFSPMGAEGAALASVIAQMVNLLLLLLLLRPVGGLPKGDKTGAPGPFLWKQYGAMLLPVLFTEFMWVLGENVYGGIYGHMGTEVTAAMTLTGPIQNLLIGALTGLSQAAGILAGRRLGSEDEDGAYDAAMRIMGYGLLGSVLLCIMIVLTRGQYVEIYRVEEQVKQLTCQVLTVYSLIAPVKVLNMISGGILGSGGKTQYNLVINLLGTWVFGVPLGLLSAFVWELTIPWVYLLLSLEECVRLAMCFVVMKKRWWMRSIR